MSTGGTTEIVIRPATSTDHAAIWTMPFDSAMGAPSGAAIRAEATPTDRLRPESWPMPRPSVISGRTGTG